MALGSRARRTVAAAAVALLTFLAPAASARVSPRPDPTVGAIYLPGLAGSAPRLDLPHYCTGSVVRSPGHNVVLTAAHCVVGLGIGMEFVPAYRDGQAPYGAWDVTRVYVDQAWLAHQDPRHDFAFLRLAGQIRGGKHVEIQDVVGGHALGTAPPAGRPVTVSGYVAGSGDEPITCAAAVYYTGAYPTFDCPGFAGGTSGSPWITRQSVVGVIGGLDGGGCTAGTSYSAPFGADVRALYRRAVAGGVGDVVVSLALLSSC